MLWDLWDLWEIGFENQKGHELSSKPSLRIHQWYTYLLVDPIRINHWWIGKYIMTNLEDGLPGLESSDRITPIYKPWSSAIWKGLTITMVLNHLQVYKSLDDSPRMDPCWASIFTHATKSSREATCLNWSTNPRCSTYGIFYLHFCWFV